MKCRSTQRSIPFSISVPWPEASLRGTERLDSRLLTRSGSHEKVDASGFWGSIVGERLERLNFFVDGALRSDSSSELFFIRYEGKSCLMSLFLC